VRVTRCEFGVDRDGARMKSEACWWKKKVKK
jgi:hypothetical protein